MLFGDGGDFPEKLTSPRIVLRSLFCLGCEPLSRTLRRASLVCGLSCCICVSF